MATKDQKSKNPYRVNKNQKQEKETKKEVKIKKPSVVPVVAALPTAANKLEAACHPANSPTGEVGQGSKKLEVREDKDKKTINKSPNHSKEPQTMEELLAQTGYQLKGIKRGGFAEGTITYIGSKNLLIDVGGKTDGVLHEKEWDIIGDLISSLKVGSKVTCYVVLPENDKGQAVLSLKKSGFEFKWKKMEEKKKTGEAVSVRGREVNRGGLICETGENLMGFLPSSQMDTSHYGRGSDLINRFIQVKVIEADKKQNRLIFSERQVVGLEKKQAMADLLKEIKIGDSYEGKVTGIVPFGIFVEVNGLSGLVHISEIAWERVNNPADYFKVGIKIKVMVLGIDEASGKLNLSVKQLLPDPWQELAKKYSLNQTVKGKISRISPFGAFVMLEPGVEGLIHISKIPPEKELAEGDEIECVIESIDDKKRRISLALVMKEKPIGYR